jgi:hypothetical protein
MSDDIRVHAYRAAEAAEIVRLCLAAGVPEQAVDWLADGYSIAAVAGNLRAAAPTAAFDAARSNAEHSTAVTPNPFGGRRPRRGQRRPLRATHDPARLIMFGWHFNAMLCSARPPAIEPEPPEIEPPDAPDAPQQDGALIPEQRRATRGRPRAQRDAGRR